MQDDKCYYGLVVDETDTRKQQYTFLLRKSQYQNLIMCSVIFQSNIKLDKDYYVCVCIYNGTYKFKKICTIIEVYLHSPHERENLILGHTNNFIHLGERLGRVIPKARIPEDEF